MKKLFGLILCLMILQVMSLSPAYAQTAEAQARGEFYIAPKFIYSYLGYTNDISGFKPIFNAFGLSVAVGYDFNTSNIRVELEYTSSTEKNSYSATPTSLHENKESVMTTFAFVNSYIDFNSSNRFVPYIGLGIGRSTVHKEVFAGGVPSSPVISAESSLAFNAGVGFSVKLFRNFRFDMSGRFIHIANDVLLDQNARFQALAGLRITF